MYSVALHECGQAIAFDGEWWHSIVTHQWVCECHQLPRVGGICEALGISHHGSIENHLSCHGFVVAEGLSLEGCSVLQNQCYILHLVIVMFLFAMVIFLKMCYSEFLFVLIYIFDIIDECHI